MAAERLKAALRAMLQEFRVDYLALYPATVLKDYGDMTLDLRADNPNLPELVKVPLRTFLPGVSVEVLPNSRVLLGFENGDPARPVAQLFDGGSLKNLTITATRTVTVNAPTVNLAGTEGTGVLLQGQSLTFKFDANPIANVLVTGTVQAGGSAKVKGVQ